MKEVRIAFLGFGTVGRALSALLERRRDELAYELGVCCRVTGMASRRLGWCADAAGLEVEQPGGAVQPDVNGWLAASAAHVVFEAIPLDPMRGQPALDFLRAALRHGAHGLPPSCWRPSRVAPRWTTAWRRRSGSASPKPILRTTLTGWDSAVKLCALGNVLLGGDLRPVNVDRTGIRALGEVEVRRAAADGQPYRLLGEIARDAHGNLTARVAPAQCRVDAPLGVVHGASLVMHYTADVFPGGLTVTSHDPIR